MMRKFLFCFVTLQILFSEFATAQLYIEETFFPVYVRKNDYRNGEAGGGQAEDVPVESGVGYDFRTTIGYTFSTGIILGLTYNYYQVNTSRGEIGGASPVEGVDRKVGKSELGPTVGISLGSWKFLGTFFVMGDKTFSQRYISGGATSTDENFKNTGIGGFQLTINYGLSLGGGFEIGPSLIYRTVKYSKQSYSKAPDPTSASYPESSMLAEPIDDELRPMVTITYRSGGMGGGRF